MLRAGIGLATRRREQPSAGSRMALQHRQARSNRSLRWSSRSFFSGDRRRSIVLGCSLSPNSCWTSFSSSRARNRLARDELLLDEGQHVALKLMGTVRTALLGIPTQPRRACRSWPWPDSRSTAATSLCTPRWRRPRTCSRWRRGAASRTGPERWSRGSKNSFCWNFGSRTFLRSLGLMCPLREGPLPSETRFCALWASDGLNSYIKFCRKSVIANVNSRGLSHG